MRAANSVILAGALLAVSTVTVVAQVAPALVIRDVNLRAQPTTQSYSFGIIPGGTTVNAGPCGGGWCQAFIGGQTGFISQGFLDFGGPAYTPRVYPAPPPPPPVIYGPPVVYGPPPPPPPPLYGGWGWRRW
jgi:hypothetical protein